MNKKDLKRFKTMLEESKKQLLLSAKKTLTEESSFDTDDLPDEIDLASSEYTQSMIFRLRDREKFLLAKIDKALARIENGGFGICEKCEEEISMKRLEARPVTTLCIRCKEEQEQKESRSGSQKLMSGACGASSGGETLPCRQLKWVALSSSTIDPQQPHADQDLVAGHDLRWAGDAHEGSVRAPHVRHHHAGVRYVDARVAGRNVAIGREAHLPHFTPDGVLPAAQREHLAGAAALEKLRQPDAVARVRRAPGACAGSALRTPGHGVHSQQLPPEA